MISNSIEIRQETLVWNQDYYKTNLPADITLLKIIDYEVILIKLKL